MNCTKGILLIAGFVCCAPATSLAQESVVQSRLERRLRERLFLDAQLGLQQRQLVYEDDAVEGTNNRSELRVHISGQVGAGDDPFGAYVGLGFVGRRTPSAIPGVGDPLGDPYDDFEVARAVRLNEGYGQYALRDADRRTRLIIRAGRLSDLNRNAGLLLFDGAGAELNPSDRLTLRTHVGRRATLDGDLRDGRTDLPVQLVGGASGQFRFGSLAIEAGYAYEEVHQPSINASWESDNVRLGFGAELIASDSTAAVVWTDGDYWTSSRHTNASWYVSAQLGDDPRSYGRAGITPESEDIEAATRIAVRDGELERLFFGQLESNIRAQADAAHWFTDNLSFHAGAFLRAPIDGDRESGLRPGVVEFWGGPELTFTSNLRAGVEAQYSIQDPGDSTDIFAEFGDGERNRGTMRVHGEVGFRASDSMRVAVRPELSAFVYETTGVGFVAENQSGGAATMLLTMTSDAGFRAAARYGIESLPEFDSDGVTLGHDVRVWLGATY